MAGTATPGKYFSTDDYTNDLIIGSCICLVVGTLAIVARILVRIKVGQWKLADYLCVIGYCGFLINVIANCIGAKNGAVGVAVPTPENLAAVKAAFSSIGIAFPVGVLAAKLSLLFFFRDIFSMRMTWFRIGWWIIFFLLVPCWIALSLTFGILGIVSPGVLIGPAQEIGVPVSSFLNALTDVMMVILPIKITLSLKITWAQRAQVLFIFCLGLGATAVSLTRAGRSIISRTENWDPRYHLYTELLIGVCEYCIVVTCACLPVIRPLFRDFGKSFRTFRSNVSRSLGGTKKSTLSLSSNAYNDDQAPINLQSNVIHRSTDIKIESTRAVRTKSTDSSFT